MKNSVFNLLDYFNRNYQSNCCAFVEFDNLSLFNSNINIPLDGFQHLFYAYLSKENFEIVSDKVRYPDYIIPDVMGELVYIWNLDK